MVEGEPGAAIVVAAWMLDPAVCAAMEIGPLTFPWRRLSIFNGYQWNTDSGEASQTTVTKFAECEIKVIGARAFYFFVCQLPECF